MRNDYNRHHFTRDESFQQSWDHLDADARQGFIDYRSYALSKMK